MKLMIGLLVMAGVAFAVLLGIFLSGMGRFEEEVRPNSQASLKGAPKVFSGVRGHAEPTSFHPQDAPASRLRPGMKRISPISAEERRALQEQRQLERERASAQAEQSSEEDPAPLEEGVFEEVPAGEEGFTDELLPDEEALEEIPLEDVPLEEIPEEEVFEGEELPEGEPFVEDEGLSEEEVPFEEVPQEQIP